MLIQSSANGWVALPPCQFIGWRQSSPGVCRPMVGLVMTSTRAYAKGPSRTATIIALIPVVSLLTHASTGDPQLQHVVLIQSPVGSLILSSGFWCAQDFVCVLHDQSLCFPQPCGSSIIKPHRPSGSESLGIPSPFVRSQRQEACTGAQRLHNSGITSLLLLFSSLLVIHPVGMGFDFIVIVPLLPPCCDFILSLDVGYLSWGILVLS